jgi:hypothetical protein
MDVLEDISKSMTCLGTKYFDTAHADKIHRAQQGNDTSKGPSSDSDIHDNNIPHHQQQKSQQQL